jgi:hypothetical protein
MYVLQSMLSQWVIGQHRAVLRPQNQVAPLCVAHVQPGDECQGATLQLGAPHAVYRDLP